jgi:hypothetical protein
VSETVPMPISPDHVVDADRSRLANAFSMRSMSAGRGRTVRNDGPITMLFRGRSTVDRHPWDVAACVFAPDGGRTSNLFSEPSRSSESLIHRISLANVDSRVRGSVEGPIRIRRGTILASSSPRWSCGMYERCQILTGIPRLQTGILRSTVWACEFKRPQFQLPSAYSPNASWPYSEPSWAGVAS